MPKAVLMRTNGNVEIFSPGSLKDYQAAVGGYIEPIYLKDAVVLVDEEGLLKRKEPNVLLERFLTEVGGPLAQRVVGDALIVGRGGEDFADVPEWVVTWVKEQLSHADR